MNKGWANAKLYVSIAGISEWLINLLGFAFFLELSEKFLETEQVSWGGNVSPD